MTDNFDNVIMAGALKQYVVKAELVLAVCCVCLDGESRSPIMRWTGLSAGP